MPRRLLSDQEVAHYHATGQLTPTHRLPEGLMADLTLAIEDLMAGNPAIRTEQLVGAHVAASADTGVRGRPELLELACHPDILDMVEQLIGPDMIIWGSQVFSKSAGSGLAIPWHQDGQYWPMRPLANVTVWIAIDPATVENGCLRIIPGTHRQGVMRHYVDNSDALALNQALEPGQVDESQAVDIELEPGQVSMHDALLAHGSNANPSGKRRCGYAVRYMPATSHFDRSLAPIQIAHNQVIDFSQRPIWLVRGEDRAGNDFRPGREA